MVFFIVNMSLVVIMKEKKRDLVFARPGVICGFFLHKLVSLRIKNFLLYYYNIIKCIIICLC